MSSSAIAQGISLDGIIITSTKTLEAAIDALSGTSTIGEIRIDDAVPVRRVAEISCDAALGHDVRDRARHRHGRQRPRVQDFGRVNVLIDGARQNFQKTGHNADGVFYIDPEMIKRVEVTRGPAATIYGSGAIGGVVAFDLIDADDILRPGETAAIRSRTRYSTNRRAAGRAARLPCGSATSTSVGQLNGRRLNEYEDGSGKVVPNSAQQVNSGMVKSRWRFAPGPPDHGHHVDYNSQFVDTTATGGSPRDTDVTNQQYSLGYTFSRPDTPLVDFSAKIYRNQTEVEQRRRTAVFIAGHAGFPAGRRQHSGGRDARSTSILLERTSSTPHASTSGPSSWR